MDAAQVWEKAKQFKWVKDMITTGDAEADVKEIFGASASFDFTKSAINIAPHMSFEHYWDALLAGLVPPRVFARLTEEAFDHFFCYLYYLTPAINPKSIFAKARARGTWQVIVESETVLVPGTTGPLAQRAQRNRAYA